jgi:hypothetical protein
LGVAGCAGDFDAHPIRIWVFREWANQSADDSASTNVGSEFEIDFAAEVDFAFSLHAQQIAIEFEFMDWDAITIDRKLEVCRVECTLVGSDR